MEEFIIHQIQNINIPQLIAIFLIGWAFYKRLEKKIEKSENSLEAKIQKSENSLEAKIQKSEGSLEAKIQKCENSLEAKMDKLSDRVDRLAEKVEDVDRRLCRIEGSLSTQGHCLFSQNQHEKKAE